MTLAYYSRSATTDAAWSEHWRGHTPESLARVAETSPLTDLILAHVPAGARVLEAGCGLGQYVVLLRRRGRRAVGVDWSESALHECRAWVPGTPLARMDVRALAFPAGAFDAYVSLGVVEHFAEGPDRIVREAHRVLAPGGVLVLSVPYVNTARRLGSWWIRRRNRRVHAAGGEFYQFAFTRRELAEILERSGFRVLAATPYDPARILRATWRTVARALGADRPGENSRATMPAIAKDAMDGTASMGPRRAGQASTPRAIAKRLLYTRASLHAFGHMILFTAVRR